MNILIHKILPGQDIEECLKIRRKVFIEGQNVPEEEELDGLDHDSDHYIIRLNDVTSGTARIRYIQNKAKIERVAILTEYQGQGLGKKLMEYLIKAIRDSSKVKIAILGAQTHAIPFYENLGFSICSDEYIEAGIPHRDMQIILNS
ncbi:GNAT family N-acetyltransferase [Candidatus Trichorickettsia mobilis]|uniref:GNAT family N-acetyltransferase n=1 Tax=Candidatus Trichorickettsia mobilis TaxID=1346319 RepID=A0ABZ0UTD8_9RICK|nr:GNAT family N-acetyltransferase [Candidatus Trichorickettsia mobilis]WPY00233.1 GNAT family N-acetyltransferase [Candidatus Trichorickettsia mobilis]